MTPHIWRSLLLGLAVVVGSSGPASAQTENQVPGTPGDGLLSPDALSRAIERSGGAAMLSAPASQTGEVPQLDGPNWPTRHPILTGTLVGLGGGTIAGAAMCSTGDPPRSGCARAMGFLGAGVGAWTGLVASRVRKAGLTYDASSGPNVSEAMRIVVNLGVGEGIRADSTDTGIITGRIQDIEADAFSSSPTARVPR